MSQQWDLNPWPLPYQGSALPLSYVGLYFSLQLWAFSLQLPAYCEPYTAHLLERKTRFELATYSLEGYRSTNWATSAYLISVCKIIKMPH